MTKRARTPTKASLLEPAKTVDSIPSSSEGNDLAHRGDIGEAVKPGIDVVKVDRAAFKPIDR